MLGFAESASGDVAVVQGVPLVKCYLVRLRRRAQRCRAGSGLGSRIGGSLILFLHSIASTKAFKLIITAYCHLLSPFIGLILKVRAINCGYDAESIVKLAYSFGQDPPLLRPFKIKPMQVYTEILSLAKIIYNLRPKNLVEIGTAGGGTLFIFTKISDPRAKIISIDLPGGPFGGGYPPFRIPLYKSFARKGQKIYLIRANSHNPKTLDKIKEILNGKELDFLFIDGDHTYEGVKKDFEMYSPLVKGEGIIVFHDIVPHDKRYDPKGVIGVPRFWMEIKVKYRNVEIIRDKNQGWAGIGLCYVQRCGDRVFHRKRQE